MLLTRKKKNKPSSHGTIDPQVTPVSEIPFLEGLERGPQNYPYNKADTKKQRHVVDEPEALLLYCCFTAALLLLYWRFTAALPGACRGRARGAACRSSTALLLLYYCFTTALLLLYYCFTTPGACRGRARGAACKCSPAQCHARAALSASVCPASAPPASSALQLLPSVCGLKLLLLQAPSVCMSRIGATCFVSP